MSPNRKLMSNGANTLRSVNGSQFGSSQYFKKWMVYKMTFDTQSLPNPVYLDKVNIRDGLWGERQTINRMRTIPSIYDQLQRTGRLDAWKMDPDREVPKKRSVITMFWDSDTAKWLEAVGYSLHTHPDPELEEQADKIIHQMEKAQQPDGYLNTYFGNLEPENKWRNLRDWHEMYNAGHLIEGAVAYFKATGKRTYLDVMSRYADHIYALFGPSEDQIRGYDGHPEIEMALVRLYRETGDEKYLSLCKFFIDERGQQPHFFDLEAKQRGEDPADFWARNYKYCQAHQPIREQEKATGHAVRACYLYAGIADLALETQDHTLLEVSRKLWDDLTRHQMYITGGLGPAHSNEGFTFDYDLPNETAYAETCASIALAFWAHRMFHIDPDSRYIDVMERALYNTVLSGVSHSGDQFFYANPLSAYPHVNPFDPWNGINSGEHYHRKEWFFCPCCPPNLARLVASIGAYFYSVTPDRLYVHLYNENSADFEFKGAQIQLQQETHYPWDGKIQITVHTETSLEFEIALRIPGWCRDYSIQINGNSQNITLEKGYGILNREWKTGDQITLTLEMPVDRIAPHPYIRHNAGQIALQRGPIVYCLEEADNGVHLANVIIPPEAPLKAEFDPELFGGATVIYGEAVRTLPASWSDQLYEPQSTVTYTNTHFQFKAIPYFLWSNRELGEMRVWVREA